MALTVVYILGLCTGLIVGLSLSIKELHEYKRALNELEEIIKEAEEYRKDIKLLNTDDSALADTLTTVLNRFKKWKGTDYECDYKQALEDLEKVFETEEDAYKKYRENNK